MRFINFIALSLVLLLSCAAFAQSEPADQQTNENTVDTRPIGGAEQIGVNTIPAGLSIQPSFRFSQTIEGNNGMDSLDFTTNLGGKLEISRARNRDRLSMSYEGGALYVTRTGQGSTSFHNFNIAETFGHRRWTFSVFDTVNYSPEAISTGTPGLPGLGNLTGLLGQAGLDPSLLPSQSILTLNTSRVSNSVAGQAQYNFSYRTSMTFGGDFGVLRFIDRGFLDSDQYTGYASVEHMLSARNTVALKYTYTAMTYTQLPGGMHTNSAQLILSRRMTNRLSAHLAIGPELISGSQFVTGKNTTGWGANGGIQYQRQRYSFDLTGARQTTAGSGVLLGARNDSIALSASRSILRNWSATIHGGYSRTAAMSGRAGVYNVRSYGMQVNRHLGQTMSMYLSYTGQDQTTPFVSNSPFLLDGWRHIFGFGFDWHPRATVTRQ